MADIDNEEETAPRGNDWEVVSLSASAYAAAPGFVQVDPSHDKSTEENTAESSRAVFLSSHFIFPPSQHENLPLEPEYSDNETHDEKIASDLDSSLLVEQKRMETDEEGTGDDNASMMAVEFPGIQIFDDEGNILSASGAAEFENDDEEKSFCSTPAAVEPESGPEKDDDKSWWKKKAISLYSQAKEANAFWSIFVAAAVMGLVMLGHRWQQERWQAFHLKLFPLGSTDEGVSRMLSPLSRFKDVYVGGARRGSLLGARASSSGEGR